MTSETYLNASQAHQLTGKSLPTIRKYLANGKFPNATQTPKGKVQVWQIPLTDLVAAGLTDSISSSSPPTPEAGAKETAPAVTIAELQTALQHTRELLARAESELQRYINRERQLFSALETRAAQERRRFSWFRRNPQTATQTPTEPPGTNPEAG